METAFGLQCAGAELPARGELFERLTYYPISRGRQPQTVNMKAFRQSPMPYTQNLRNAADRHFTAAKVLHQHSSGGSQPGCKTVAGYLFGIAGELAIKELMRDSGMRPLPAEDRRDDPFYAHFPAL